MKWQKMCDVSHYHTLCTTQLTDASDHFTPCANALGNDQNQLLMYDIVWFISLAFETTLPPSYFGRRMTSGCWEACCQAMVFYLITHASLSITACHNLLPITSFHMYTICTRRIHHPHTVLHTTGVKTAACCQTFGHISSIFWLVNYANSHHDDTKPINHILAYSQV